jgi:hypothetical protein
VRHYLRHLTACALRSEAAYDTPLPRKPQAVLVCGVPGRHGFCGKPRAVCAGHAGRWTRRAAGAGAGASAAAVSASGGNSHGGHGGHVGDGGDAAAAHTGAAGVAGAAGAAGGAAGDTGDDREWCGFPLRRGGRCAHAVKTCPFHCGWEAVTVATYAQEELRMRHAVDEAVRAKEAYAAGLRKRRRLAGGSEDAAGAQAQPQQA